MNPHLPPPHRQQPPSHNHPRYDAENRLISLDGGATTYGYEADGQRVSKTTAGALTDFIYDRDGHIILTNPSAPTQVELYVDGMHLATKTINAQQTDTNTYFDHADWLGTERARTDWAGICETVASLPFGDGETPSTTCSEGDVSPMHFTGKQRDAESGLDNFGARYDSSSFGRFMTPDWAASPTAVPYAAFGDPQTLNLYAYAVNAPVDRADSDGHCLIDFNCISTVYDTVPTSKNDNTTTTICSGPRCPSPSTSGATVTPDQQTNTQQAQQQNTTQSTSNQPAQGSQQSTSGINPNYKIPTFDLVLKKASDFSAGAGDFLSFGLTQKVRQHFHYDNVVDTKSGAYLGGEITGLGITAAGGHSLLGNSRQDLKPKSLYMGLNTRFRSSGGCPIFRSCGGSPVQQAR